MSGTRITYHIRLVKPNTKTDLEMRGASGSINPSATMERCSDPITAQTMTAQKNKACAE
jgi:hypothetical protein